MTLSEPISHLRHWSRTALELITGIATQVDPTLLLRIDAEKFLSSISCVVDGERVRAPSWDLSPTWEGEDVKIGKRYEGLLQSAFNVNSLAELAKEDPAGLMRLWNSDNVNTVHPFNKPRLTDARDSWLAHVRTESAAIPVSVSISETDLIGLEERFQGRRKGRGRSAVYQVGKERKRKRQEEEQKEGSDRDGDGDQSEESEDGDDNGDYQLCSKKKQKNECPPKKRLRMSKDKPKKTLSKPKETRFKPKETRFKPKETNEPPSKSKTSSM